MPGNYRLVSAKDGLPSHIPIGNSPAGVTWNVYPKSGEDLGSLSSRVAFQQERLQAMWSKHNALSQSVSPTDMIHVRNLTENGVGFIVDHASLVEGEEGKDYQSVKFGKSYVKASRRLLEAVEDRLLDDVDNHGDLARCGYAVTEEQQDFAERSARRSILVALKRIRLALENKKQPKKVHIADHLLTL